MSTIACGRFLIIAYSFTGTGANMLRYRSFVNFLCRQGYEVDVIGFYEKKDAIPKGCNYIRLSYCLSIGFLLTFLRLFICNLYLIRVQGIKSYIKRICLASLTYNLAVNLIKRNDYRSCLVGILPWAYYLIIPMLTKRIRTILDIGDPLYKNAINKNSCHFANFRLERKALTHADYVITMNEPTIKIMEEEFGISLNKMSFVSPSMNVEAWESNVKISYITGEKLRIIYSGSLYKGYRDLDEFISAIESMNDVTLDVFTNSVYRPNNSRFVKVHGVVPHTEILNYYNQYDILLFVDNFYGYQVPSKIFELIAQNKPILFIYDERNTYLYEKLKKQKGIYFVLNRRNSIITIINQIRKLKTIDVNYDFDLSCYSEMNINKQLLSKII